MPKGDIFMGLNVRMEWKGDDGKNRRKQVFPHHIPTLLSTVLADSNVLSYLIPVLNLPWRNFNS